MFLCSIFVFVHMFLFYSVFPYADVSYPTSKRARTDSNNFKSIEANLKYNDYYKRATIIVERVVKLDTLEDTCIPTVFRERTWKKLLNLVRVLYSKIIREFFSNASVERDNINC